MTNTKVIWDSVSSSTVICVLNILFCYLMDTQPSIVEGALLGLIIGMLSLGDSRPRLLVFYPVVVFLAILGGVGTGLMDYFSTITEFTLLANLLLGALQGVAMGFPSGIVRISLSKKTNGTT